MIKILLSYILLSTICSANYVEKPKLYTRREMRKLSALEFKQILKEASSALPTKKEYPPLAPGKVAQIHHHWKDTGAALHEIAQIIKINNTLSRKGLSFFKNCAKNKQVLTEFAAICLTHYSVFIRTNRIGSIKKNEFPREVVRLASILVD
ncbi:hypothetical protein A9Q84_09395 [Halobacteriovorax marinus]|uniref:Uncharacterized protein n=1 Tax=Halobacteriovorax marinus TaxID=97084 RepID=A0A1Y5F6M8_9BACT|nr:hypothetical protein A9Q84_09395 [Halobacteriovorax marinus]